MAKVTLYIRPNWDGYSVWGSFNQKDLLDFSIDYFNGKFDTAYVTNLNVKRFRKLYKNVALFAECE